MKGWTARILLAVFLAPSALAAGEFSLTELRYRLPAPCYSKLDLNVRCGGYKGSGGWIEFKAADPRFEKNAITLRFGGPSPDSPSKIEVQIGSFLQTALFVAALVVTFL